jgi:superfamily II DNA or RNA helicase
MNNLNNKKGHEYEIQIFDYLKINYQNYQIFMWKNIPHKYIIKYVFDDVNKLYNEKNNFIDIGCDIFMVDKSNEENVIIVQCKNYENKNVCIDDLSGFFHLIALSHIPIRGFIISNTFICERLQRKLKLIETVKFFNIKYYVNPIIKMPEIFTPKDYQIEAKNKFNEIDKGILKLFCGMGKTYTSILISMDYDNIFILSPMKNYAFQLLEEFTKHMSKDYSTFLISSDGYRDENEILKNTKTKNIFSSTFCSSNILDKIICKLKNSILIVDEFHNLSFNNLVNVNSSLYKILTSKNITKKLFMSATPKIYEVNKENIKTHSIDNFEHIFGKIFFSYEFENAIKQKYINDYQIIVPNYNIEKNKYEFIYSNMLYHGYKKCMVYCKNIEDTFLFKESIMNINNDKFKINIYVQSITNKTNFNKRQKILKKFLDDNTVLNFIISVHTMDECIDVPKCDCVYITYDVSNPINIIQRISRCLRIYPNKIKSGIFLWCSKYKDLKKINNIVQHYSINFFDKIFIKTLNQNEENVLKLEFINETTDEDVKKLKNCKKCDNLEIYYDIPDNFIKDFYYLGDEKFNINLECVSKWLNCEKSKLKKTLLKTYILDTDYILKKEIIDKKISKSNKEIILLTVECLKKLLMFSKTKKSALFRENYLMLENMIINRQGVIINNLQHKIKETINNSI